MLHFFNKGKYELENLVVNFDSYEFDVIDLLDKWKDPEFGIFNSSDKDSDSRSHNSKRSSRTRNTSKNTNKTNGVPAAAEMLVIKKIKLNKIEKISNLTSGIKWSKGQNTMIDSWFGR